MPTAIEQPGPAIRQISGKDPQGKYLLAVIASRTYTFTDRGQWSLAPAQRPLIDEPEMDKEVPDLLKNDADLYPLKPLTDVVVKGHAHGRDGQRQMNVIIQIGAANKQIAVFGDRQCTRTAAGKLAFSSAAPITKIPLAYTHAYGGRDKVAEESQKKEVAPKSEKLGYDLNQLVQKLALAYPRNPVGRGFLIKATAEAVEALKLPNLEDPADLLTPERLETGHFLHWPKMPLPQAADWLSFTWFPRMAALGVMPMYQPRGAAEKPFAEVTRKLVPPNLFQAARSDNPDVFHVTCGASLGLQLPFLRGDEPFSLQGLSAKFPSISARLPADRPRISTDGRKGKFNKTDPVIHTILIEPDDLRVTIIWRGSAPALRPYMPEELKKMPLKVEWQS